MTRSRLLSAVFWGHAIRNILAVVGLLMLAFWALSAGLRSTLFVDTVDVQLKSPNGALLATREVVQGGFGTVNTVRIRVASKDGSRSTIVYENRDSDVAPELQWHSNEELLLTLPCGQVGFVSNPNAVAAGSDALARLTVRFSNLPGQCVAEAL